MRLRSSLLLLAPALLLGAASVRAGDPMFDPGRLHEVRIVMDPADWQALRANFRTNDYYAANVSIDGEVIQQVGIRSRGKGSRSAEKPALLIDTNKYVAGQEFHGYKTIVLLNLVQDQSMLRESLALPVFTAMGIAASQIGHTRVTVNNEYWGVYNIKEDVTKPFLQNNLGDKEGTLYKYEWADEWWFTTRGGNAEAYIPLPFEPKTNEKSLDPAPLIDFVNKAINESSDASFLGEVSKYIDPDQFLTYIAVENAIAESDGMLGQQGMNNFYLYQLTGQNKFVFIVWDKNTSYQNPSWPLYKNVEQNVLARRLLTIPTKKQLYVDQVKKAVNSYVNTPWLGPKLEAMYTMIRESALADTKKPYTNTEFELSVSGLRGIIGARQADVSSQAQ
jgi:spore coat protein CotH